MKKRTRKEADVLGDALENLYGLVAWRVFRHASTMLEGEVTFARILTLFHLYRRGPETIATLAEGAGLSQAAASRMIDGLVRTGMVDRRESADDRRQKTIEITRAGIDRLKALQAETAGAYTQLMEDVPEVLRKRLSSVLDEIEPFLSPLPASGETADRSTGADKAARARKLPGL